MAGLPSIDPDFEPQTRPRAGTWPMKRPVIASQKDNFDNDVSMKLEPTIEEATSQEHLVAETMINQSDAMMCLKQETPNGFMLPNSFSVTDHCNGLVSSPANLVTNYPNQLISQQQPLNVNALDSSTNGLSFANLEPILQSKPIPGCSFGAVSMSSTTQGNLDIKPNVSNTTSELHKQLNSTVSSDATTVASPSISKPKTSSRKNAWGNMSYADLITQGIESSPDKRLTLAQIYDWMVKNVPYFKDKGDSNSSAGWKNSIRHNLSLHNKFKRIQNEGTGKSSWWVINHDAKPGKPSRKRTTSLDTNSAKLNKSRARALSKKNELQKKLKPGSKRDSPTWARSPTAQDGSTDFEHQLNKSLVSDFSFPYRARTSSNASSLGGRMSPPRSLLTQDLEDDGPPPLSPLSTPYTTGGHFDLFGRNDAFSLVGELDPLTGTSDLLESINIDALNPSSPMAQCSGNDRTNVYLNSSASGQSQLQALNNKNNQPSNKVLSGVDISGSVPRVRSNTMPKLQPQPKYNMSESLRHRQSGEALSASQRSLLFPTFNNANSQQHNLTTQNAYTQFPYNRSQQQPTQQQVQQQMMGRRSNDVNSINQSQMNMNRQQVSSIPMSNQQRQPSRLDNNMQMQSYSQPSQVQPVQQPQRQDLSSNLVQMNQKYPSDLDIDNQDIFDPGASDFDPWMLREMEPPATEGFLGMGVNSFYPQDNSNLDLGDRMDTNSSVGMANSNPVITKRSTSNGSAFPFPNNQVTLGTVNMQQQQQQQRFGQPTPNIYSMNIGNGCPPKGMTGVNTASNGPMILGNGPVMGTGLLPQFNHSHQVLRPKSSVGPINDFQL